MTEEMKQLKDLSNRVSRSIVAVVDAVCTRGGFKGEELSTIGQLRDQAIQVIQMSEQMDQAAAMETGSDDDATPIDAEVSVEKKK